MIAPLALLYFVPTVMKGLQSFRSDRSIGGVKEVTNVDNLATCVIKTRGRVHLTLSKIRSIRELFPKVKINIGDDGMDDLGFEYIPRIENVKYLKLAFDAGMSVSRNALIAMVDTPYVWLLDDDFIVADKFAALHAIGMLEKGEADLVGFEFGDRSHEGENAKSYAARLLETPCYFFMNPQENTLNVTTCFRSQRVSNFIARTSLLVGNPWESKLKLAEQNFFFADLAISLPETKIWSCPSTNIRDIAISSTSEYRYASERAFDYFNKAAVYFIQRHGRPLLSPSHVRGLVQTFCGKEASAVDLTTTSEFPNYLDYRHREKLSLPSCSKKLSPIWFLHITKTGGSAVEHAMSNIGIDVGSCLFKEQSLASNHTNLFHCSSISINPHFQRSKEEFYDSYVDRMRWRGSPWHVPPGFFEKDIPASVIFTVVRNPYDRLLSTFTCPWSGHKIHSEYSSSEALNEFTLNLLQNKGERDVLLIPQVDYVEWNSRKADYVLKYESLENDLAHMMETLNLFPVALDRVNEPASRRNLTAADFNCTVLGVINSHFSDDFSHFGYEKVSCDD